MNHNIVMHNTLSSGKVLIKQGNNIQPLRVTVTQTKGGLHNRIKRVSVDKSKSVEKSQRVLASQRVFKVIP